MIIFYWCLGVWGFAAWAISVYLYAIGKQNGRSKSPSTEFITLFLIVAIRLPLHFLFAYGRAAIQILGTVLGFYRDEKAR